MFKTKTFTSIDEKHEISISYCEEIAWFNINKLECEYYKTFLLLIKDIMKFMVKENITYIKQYIECSEEYSENQDEELFKNSEHSYIDDNRICITTHINNFLDELINALGIKPI